jgi:hypothetical protein
MSASASHPFRCTITLLADGQAIDALFCRCHETVGGASIRKYLLQHAASGTCH